MNDPESLESSCRICLGDDVERDWNQLLYDSLLTYKDCYYKYTQLEYVETEDKFSTWLCRNCSNGLEYIETFISTAIETDSLLRKKFTLNITVEDGEDEIKDEAMNFETILIEEIGVKSETPELEITNMYECSTEELVTGAADEICIIPKKCVETGFNYAIENLNTASSDNVCIIPENSAPSLAQTKKNLKYKSRRRKTTKLPNSSDQSTNDESSLDEGRKLQNSSDQITNNESVLDDKNPAARIEKQMCCSICSKVLSNRYSSIKHEQTHCKNRERNMSCDKCGLKFYSKVTLRSHMLTHLENREKTYKCEFCDKAFFNRSGLTVHRRIHLGQMVTCLLCTKQFYRQIDLDKHMNSHSAVRITSEVKTNKKYYVPCKDCGENVRSTSFKSHIAKHNNEPLFKCSICDKEFFFRKSGIKHLKVTHKKPPAERGRFIIAYKTSRLTHLFLEQNTSIKVNDEHEP